MVVGRGGQVFFYTLMMGIAIIVLGIALSGPITSVINGFMDEAGCSVIDSDWEQAFCWFMDLEKVVLIGLFIFGGVAVIAAKEIMAR